MIDQDKRKAVYSLHNEGMSIRTIADNLNISPTSVMTIIEQKGQMPETIRKDKIVSCITFGAC